MTARPIFVLGAQRSGASLLSDLVKRWGAFAGDPGPSGGFSRELLAAAGGTLWQPDLGTRLAALAGDPAWRDRALALARPMMAGDRPWLWTLPMPSLLMPFWERLFPQPICVVAVRNPLDCARSFAASRFPAELARAVQVTAYFGFRWQFAQLTLLALCERQPDHLLVGYDALLDAPTAQVRRLARFLDRTARAAESCDERRETMQAAVDPGLRHQRAGAAFFGLPQVLDVQKELFRHLERRLAGTAEPFDAARFAVPAYAWEYLRNFDVFFELEQRPGRAA